MRRGLASGRLLCALAVAGAWGCRARPVVIGYAVPGYAAGVVPEVREELADLARRGGPRIQLVYDSTGVGETPDVEVRRAHQLAQVPGIVAVVGHGGSRSSLTAAPVYNEAGIVQIAPTSTSRLLASAGPWTFALPPDDSVEGALLARLIVRQLGARRVIVLYEDEEYGVGIVSGLRSALDALGGSILWATPVRPESNFRVMVDAGFAAGRPDLVVSAARTDGTAKLTREVHRHAPAMRVVAADGALFPQLVQQHPPGIDSVYGVAFWTPGAPDSASRAFSARFRRLRGSDPSSTEAMSRDAIMLIAEAISEVGPRPQAIRDWLRGLGRGRPPWPGVSGTVAFAGARGGALHVVHLSGGRIVEVAP